jgi:hypothetical protein
MRKPISTLTHGILDMLTAATLARLPSALGFSTRTTRALQAAAATKFAYSLMTDNELGLVRAIPMKAHLALDAASGVALAALPFMLDEDDEMATAVCIGAGLMELSSSLMTQTIPSDANYPRSAARAMSNAAASTYDATRNAVQNTRQKIGV